MATNDAIDETTVVEGGTVPIPADVRDRLGLQAGDKFRWHVDDGRLTVEVIQQRSGVFDDFEPVDVGETNAVDVEREFGSE